MTDDRFVKIFEEVAPQWEERYGACVQLNRIIGNRWSYVAGRFGAKCQYFFPRKIRLNPEWGLIIYSDDFPLRDEEVLKIFAWQANK